MEDPNKIQEFLKQIGLVIPQLKAALKTEGINIQLHGVSISRQQGLLLLNELQKILQTRSISEFNSELIPLPLLIVSDEWRNIQVFLNELNT